MKRNKYVAELINEAGCVFGEWYNASNIKAIKAWARGRGGDYTLEISVAILDEQGYAIGDGNVRRYDVRGNRIFLQK